MEIFDIPFGITDWSTVESTEQGGEAGSANCRTRRFGALRVRMIEYSAGYIADHWCTKGQVVLCLAGELESELADGRKFVLTPGTSYQVADGQEAHRCFTRCGAKVFVVD